MSAVATHRGTVARSVAAAPGETSIAAGVIEKIAGRAAGEVAGVEAARPSTVRRLLPFVDDGTVDAAVGHERASVEVAVSVRYGEPVWQRADEVRRHVIGRIEAITGLHVTRVDVTVSNLADRAPGRRRVV